MSRLDEWVDLVHTCKPLSSAMIQHLTFTWLLFKSPGNKLIFSKPLKFPYFTSTWHKTKGQYENLNFVNIPGVSNTL
jgi:hypothetical protein